MIPNNTQKIGQRLLGVGGIKPHQIDNILLRQQCGDTRKFGEIAVALRYVNPFILQKILNEKSNEKAAMPTDRIKLGVTL